ncbi:hypothetical protein V0288_13870 [Pannus brasiliensis CCIBt3594]|uniref:ADP-ribosylglycohydrolase n=1 Tax=Pannus brasiliensis CCIBt3594 TaxID=1427578 RepID=A0AAW9QK97_9CHRO
MPLFPLDRFQGALLGIYIGESLGNLPGAFPRTRFLCLALENPDPDRLLATLPDGISPEEGSLFALLPEILAFYESPECWRERSEKIARIWSLPSGASADLALWGHALSRVAAGKNPIDRPFPREILPPVETPLFGQLERVRDAIESDRPFPSTARQLARSGEPIGTAIALSLHAFGRTPSDFRLGTRIARSSPYQGALTTVLAGLWSGLYNGITGIPLAWRWRNRTDPLWREIEIRAGELYARWSGVDPRSAVPLSPSSAIATAGTIQPRKNFRPISREDF